jgi:hypothetical protein
MTGPYRILEKVENLYKLDLLGTIRIYLVFSPDRLWKAVNDPLPRQKNDPLLLIEVNGDNKWEVDEILASKIVQKSLHY